MSARRSDQSEQDLTGRALMAAWGLGHLVAAYLLGVAFHEDLTDEAASATASVSDTAPDQA